MGKLTTRNYTEMYHIYINTILNQRANIVEYRFPTTLENRFDDVTRGIRDDTDLKNIFFSMARLASFASKNELSVNDSVIITVNESLNDYPSIEIVKKGYRVAEIRFMINSQSIDHRYYNLFTDRRARVALYKEVRRLERGIQEDIICRSEIFKKIQSR